MDVLNPQQLRFIDHYIQCGQSCEAARRAGYTEQLCSRIGTKLLNTPEIIQELAERQKEISTKSKLTIMKKLSILNEGMDYYVSKKHYYKAAKLIEIANKMQGHNAPDKAVNFNFNANLSIVAELTEKYFNDYKNGKF